MGIVWGRYATPPGETEQRCLTHTHMGLSSGEFGEKSTYIKTFPNCTQKINSLDGIAETLSSEKNQTCVIVDGNVMLMSSWSSVSTMDEYVSFVTWNIGMAFNAANHVVVVFDEPNNVTQAKRAEQAKRDASRKSKVIVTSEDLPSLPKTDDFDTESLPEASRVREIFTSGDCRQARSRITDEIAKRVLVGYGLKFSGDEERSLSFDGVDPLGGSRNGPRRPCVASTHPEVATILNREVPVGEGDLKITDVSDKIERHRHVHGSPFKDISLVIVSTIDTDSLQIELLAQAERDTRGVDDFSVFLALKERSGKRNDHGQTTQAYFMTFDIECLFRNLVLHLFETDFEKVDPILRRKAMSLVALGSALTKTDFSETKGVRFEEMLTVIRTVCSDSPYVLAAMNGVWEGGDSELKRVAAVAKTLLDSTADLLQSVKIRHKHCASLRSPDDSSILRALWVVAYWNRVERKDVASWGF